MRKKWYEVPWMECHYLIKSDDVIVMSGPMQPDGTFGAAGFGDNPWE